MKTFEYILLLVCTGAILIGFKGFAQDTGNLTLPEINAVNAVVQPAQPAITYNKFWLSALSVQAPSPSKPVRLMATLIPYDGAGHTLNTHGVSVMVPDLFAAAGQNSGVAQAVGAVLQAVTGLCHAEGKCQ
jgi:hypothetical protein